LKRALQQFIGYSSAVKKTEKAVIQSLASI